jgi:MtrB/PioB family decaheme-associated outer membrane protein
MTKDHAMLRAAVLLAAGCAAPITARADDPAGETRFEALFGGQLRGDLDRLGLARFDKYRDVPEGAVLEFGRFEWTPTDRPWMLSVTAVDALRKDQRYFLEWRDPSRFSLKLRYAGLPRYYSSAASTLWSGAGTGSLTLDASVRRPLEEAAGSPTVALAGGAAAARLSELLASAARPLDLRTQRKAASGELSYELTHHLSLRVESRYEERSGTKPSSVGTYVRRQALSGIPSTGAGFFWRESIEVRGQELIEPLDYRIPELNLSASWSKKGHSVVVGWEGSWFRNDITTLRFDNPFEAAAGRASASIFDPRADQEPAAPNGNNAMRGLYAQSAIQLWPSNTFTQLYGNGSFKLGKASRATVALSQGRMRQDDPFLPYAANDQVVFSGVAGQPGAVSAAAAPLPRASLDGQIRTTRVDLKLTSRPIDALSLRAGYRYYDYDDRSAEIVFPGYASSSDSFFRRSIGQTDAQGNRTLFNEVGGYRRQRLTAGAAYRLGNVTFDGEYARTQRDYDTRQVEETGEDAVKGTVRYLTGGGVQVTAHYLVARRDFVGPYAVGLEASGVRAFDVWKRDRQEAGGEIEIPAGERWSLSLGGTRAKDEYPGAVQGFTQPYGLQDSASGTVYGGAAYTRGQWTWGAWAGLDRYDWNSLQVTKTGLTKDYDPVNRWTRETSDDVVWFGLDASGPLTKKASLRVDLQYQRYRGDWTTINLGTPDINSAVANAFPQLKESVFTGRLSLVWALTPRMGFEARYWYEPYRLDDFTWDAVQPYMQGVLKETRSSATDIGDMNASRLLWLNSRYSSYDAHLVTAFLRLRF